VISYLTTEKHLDELWTALSAAAAEVLPRAASVRWMRCVTLKMRAR